MQLGGSQEQVLILGVAIVDLEQESWVDVFTGHLVEVLEDLGAQVEEEGYLQQGVARLHAVELGVFRGKVFFAQGVCSLL